VVIAVFAACGGRGLPPPDVVARIGGQELPYADFENYLRENSVASQTGLSSEVLSSLFDQYLDEALLGKLAVDEGHGREEDVRLQAIEALIQDSMPDEISASEIMEFFDRHRDEFFREEGVVLRQILVEERAVAETALEAIRAGMSFEDAAGVYSQGPGAELGGMQGELSRSDLPPAFADLIFALQIGEVSEIVAADYGFHLFQVIDKRSAAQPDVSQVRDVIVSRLWHESRARVVAQLVERARSSYNTTVYARNLPFNYAGFRQ
jgi:parvulin-like peptidyl-prolyl isomerase